MSYSRFSLVVTLLTVSAAAVADGNPVVVALGAGKDDTGSHAMSLLADIGLTEDTWLSTSVARTESERIVNYADIGLDHDFGPLGVRAAAAYWGNDDLLESGDLRGSLYWRGEAASLSFDLERRDFSMRLGERLLDEPVEVGFSADGVGASATLSLNDRLRLYAGGMDYEYSRDIRLRTDFQVLRFFGRSRLSLMNSLLDYQARLGLGMDVGRASLDVGVSRWRTEIDRSTVDSIAVGLLLPAGPQSDVEFRLAFDESEEYGGATVFSVFLYLFAE